MIMSYLSKIEMSSFAKLTSKGGHDGKGNIKMSKKELKRLKVIHKVLENRIKQKMLQSYSFYLPDR